MLLVNVSDYTHVGDNCTSSLLLTDLRRVALPMPMERTKWATMDAKVSLGTSCSCGIFSWIPGYLVSLFKLRHKINIRAEVINQATMAWLM